MPAPILPFWQVNVPPSLREQECPEYLLDISEKDKRIIGTPDEDFRPMPWPVVKDLIRTNRIDLFERRPTDLRKYRQYTHKLAQDYGSVMNFVLKERLQWTDLTPRGAPFTIPDDIKILYNDWPYGIDSSIIHLVIWTKFDLEEDPEIDDLTPAAREEINTFVDQTFCTKVPPEDVVWFKNWRSLKSVHAVEHFHVMLHDPDMEFIKNITNSDVPLAAKVGIQNGSHQ
ncbi:hypothetical protein NA57DRAFT_61338 [Rhizodiscina lignyota]|uniref:N-acetylglucosamine-induced protein 1 n=1 Tax=Rhizodiscina lignyota TaxID=1504668 RepID=A0A9P4I7U2_9PEZI|nr:hypothetical protein NA57DRAFT_61338 [Rhizodiscina lignyota]